MSVLAMWGLPQSFWIYSFYPCLLAQLMLRPCPAQSRAQDTVACNLLPFALPLVSWRLQVDEGNSFFIGDSLFQVEFHQVQYLWGDRKGLEDDLRGAWDYHTSV